MKLLEKLKLVFAWFAKTWSNFRFCTQGGRWYYGTLQFARMSYDAWMLNGCSGVECIGAKPYHIPPAGMTANQRKRYFRKELYGIAAGLRTANDQIELIERMRTER